MAYNYFPVNYQNNQAYYPQPQYTNLNSQTPLQYTANQQYATNQQAITPPTIHAEIVQVDNEQAAENYPLAVGASQMMIAKDDSAIYVKTMFANGQYNLDVFVKRPPQQKQQEIDTSLYVTREEFETRLQALMRTNEVNQKKDEVE